ncbi:MAG: sugar nucleotide-binding protein [Anaerolineae bacterium]|jgi:dTDP-4-dehydrorhamnose reductase|nr:sugar nucleotide-binding protein [Anaerolineae bacterium]
MKAIVTGAHGTLGQALTQCLTEQGGTVIAWDREQTPIDDYQAMETFIRTHHPDVVFHFAVPSQSTGRDNESWLVHQHWTGELAWICRELEIGFLFTSSVMVFGERAQGPFTVQSRPEATEGYPYDKLKAEERVFYQNPQAIVARLGWQIGQKAGSNNMIDWMERQMQTAGEIRVSRRWYPACSFVQDTVQTLLDLTHQAGGLYLVDSNRGWTFDQIAHALNDLHGGHWKIASEDGFAQNQRMIDDRVKIAPLNQRLPTLKLDA